MNKFSFYSIKSNLVRVILAIIFLTFIIELNAQKKDSIATVSDISGVEINASLNTSKYLWNLLKENYSIKIKDTILFYTIDFKVEVPDSNYFDYFTGVIIVEYKDNKSTVFVCEGSYNDSNIINIIDFPPLNIDISNFWKKSEIERFGKFKKYKIEHSMMLNSFSVLNNKKSRTSVIKFNNRLLSSNEIVSATSKKRLSYEFNYIYSKVKYDSLLIAKKFNVILKYKFKNVDAISSIIIERTNSIDYIEKYKIASETPSSINDILTKKH